MNKEQILGLTRETITTLSLVLLAWGVGTESLWQGVVGLITGGMSFVWGIQANESWEKLASVLRKGLSAAGGILISYGLIDQTKATAAIGLILSVVSVIWSVWKKGSVPTSGTTALLLLSCILFLPSCGADATLYYLDPDSGAKAGIIFRPEEDPALYGKVPIEDDEGNIIFIGEGEIPISIPSTSTK